MTLFFNQIRRGIGFAVMAFCLIDLAMQRIDRKDYLAAILRTILAATSRSPRFKDKLKKMLQLNAFSLRLFLFIAIQLTAIV
ncbi:hypothetical protein M422DRAFT_245455 [Sphaerobolus stellatus SS14]|nr:hypothetical protein M422DRAFT_245455 [Sphaerobolus stellatus SS14]